LNEAAELPADHAPVPDPTPLYRLVPTDHCDPVDGAWVFQSGAFDNNDDDDMSIVLDDTLQALGRIPDDLPDRTFPGQEGRWGVAVIHDAGYLRNDLEQEVRRTPRAEEPPEPAHGDVHGRKNGNRRKKIKARAEWVLEPAAPAD
jgi:hypothetical protein